MYTVVLMAAMTAGPASTGQFFSHACSGCRGCYGCWGGFSGSGYNYMVGHGFLSAFSTYAPIGCSGSGAFGCSGCFGCYGGMSCYGVPLHQTAAPVAPKEYVPPPPKTDKAKPNVEETPPPKEEKGKETKSDYQTRARLKIDAPADAKIYLDGELLNSPVVNRVFMTPVLTPGHVYYYDLKVEVVRGGSTVAETQRVLVRPGELATARLLYLGQGSAEVPVASGQE